jgi:feruloyl esterase
MDGDMNPLRVTDDFDLVAEIVGGDQQRDRFARLFMVPGMEHCGGGPGAGDQLNYVEALEAWVERGVAPNEPTGAHIEAGQVRFRRPVFPYPSKGRFIGGDVNDPRNWVPGKAVAPATSSD